MYEADFIYFKRCFERAYRFATNHPDERARLSVVHGTVTSNFAVEHAWVEVDGAVVFDGVYNRFFDRDVYYSVNRAEPLARYSVSEIFALVLREGHYGPYL